MKTFFPTLEIYHVWAHQTAPAGKCPAATSFDGPSLYSYGAEIARHVEHKGRRAVVFNESKYSDTTTRCQTLVRAAIPSGVPVFPYRGNASATPAELFNYALKSALACQLHAATKREGTAIKAASIADAAQYMESAAAVSDFFGLRRKVNDRALKRLQAEEREAEALRLKIEAKRKRAAEIRERRDLAAWMKGAPIHCNFPNSPVRLRVETREDEKQIATSRGVRVPYAEGRRTFEFLQKVRDRGWHRNGTTFAVGGYQLDAVNADGLVAGCHRIKWEEIERFAKAEGWA